MILKSNSDYGNTPRNPPFVSTVSAIFLYLHADHKKFSRGFKISAKIKVNLGTLNKTHAKKVSPLLMYFSFEPELSRVRRPHLTQVSKTISSAGNYLAPILTNEPDMCPVIPRNKEIIIRTNKTHYNYIIRPGKIRNID